MFVSVIEISEHLQQRRKLMMRTIVGLQLFAPRYGRIVQC
jgi:hypothetical protein